MPPRIRPVPRQARAAWLFAMGLLAMAMTAMGGTGVLRTHTAGTGFFVEICSAKGTRSVPGLPSGEHSLPGSQPDCCQLCATGAPLLLADATLALPPAPEFAEVRFAEPVFPRRAVTHLSHPPRGPPSA